MYMNTNHSSLTLTTVSQKKKTQNNKKNPPQQSIGKQLVISEDNFCTLVPHIDKYPVKIQFHVFLLEQYSFFFVCVCVFKLIKRYEVRPDPAGTPVKPITRTLLCPSTPINLQFLDRWTEQTESRANSGGSPWAVLAFTLCCLNFMDSASF